MPRAWLASEVFKVEPDEALAIIRSSRLPDGRALDPLRIALVEEPVALTAQNVDMPVSAKVAHLSDTTMEVHTASSSPSFLVTSDVYYPGWQATIDGSATQVFRADYALRGVLVPAGSHVVRFEFRPKSFYYGAAVSAMSFLALVLLVYGIRKSRRRVSHG